MVTTMDSAGRLVTPREIRNEAAIEPGTPLEVRFRDGIIEIEPQPLAVRLEKRGHLLVAVPNHALTEAYSVLTRFPVPHRLTPADAWAVLSRAFAKAVRR